MKDTLVTPTLLVAALAMLLALTLAGCVPDAFIADALPWTLGTLGSVVALGLARLAAKSAFLAGIIGRLKEAAPMVVLEIEQTYVDKIKAARRDDSPGGVQLTEGEAREARLAALAKLKDYLGWKGLRILGFIVGVGGDTLDGLFGTGLEASVKALSIARSNAGAIVKNGKVTMAAAPVPR